MKRLLSEIPRHVLLSVGVIVGAGAIFAVLLFVLGGARDAAVADNARLTSEIQRTQTAIAQAQGDHDYVRTNQAKYEDLLKSDRLVPHSRRAAVVELQRIAQRRGLTSLGYSFSAAASNSLQSVSAQPATAAYRLSVEDVLLKVGAPVDGAIYGFVSDISQAFPGAAVVELVTLKRAPRITDQALAALAEGRDSGLVSGEIKLSWRTAQAQETKDGGGK